MSDLGVPIRKLLLSACVLMLAVCASCGRQVRSNVSAKASTPVSLAAPPQISGSTELVLQTQRSRYPSNVAFATKAPVLIAYDDNSASVDIWDTSTWTLERTIDLNAQPSGYANAEPVAISPDGRTLAAAVADRPTGHSGQMDQFASMQWHVKLWDVASGAVVRTFAESFGDPMTVVWSHDGKRIVAGGDTVRMWGASSGKLIRTFNGSGSVAVSGNDRLLATSGSTNSGIAAQAYLFDVATGRRIRTFRDKAGTDSPVAISADGRYVATGGDDPKWDPGPLPKDADGNTISAPSEAYYAHMLKVKVWDARTGRLVRMLPGHSNNDGTRCLHFSPDGKALLSSGNGSCTLWSLRNGKALREFDTEGAGAISPDGKLVAVASGVFSASTGAKIFSPSKPPSAVTGLAFSPDGHYLASTEQTENVLRLWDLQTGRLAKAFAGPDGDVHDVTFLSAGRVVSNSLNGAIMWDIATGKAVRKWQGPVESGSITGMRERNWALLTPNGEFLVAETGTPFSTGYQVFDAASGKLLMTLSLGVGSLSNAAFSRDGRYIALSETHGRSGGNVRLADLTTGREGPTLSGKGMEVYRPAFSPGSKTVATVNASGPKPDIVDVQRMREVPKPRNFSVGFWDIGSGKLERSIPIGYGSPDYMVFSVDGGILVAAFDNKVVLYDVAACSEVINIKCDTQPRAVAISVDGTRVAIGDGSGHVQLWDIKNGRLLITMVGLPSSADGGVSSDWYAYAPGWLVDWSPGAAKLIKWWVRGKLYPAEKFERQLRRPGLLSLHQ